MSRIESLDLRRKPSPLSDKSNYDAFKAIYDLMNDGGSMVYRFMDGHQCAEWIIANRKELIRLLSELPD